MEYDINTLLVKDLPDDCRCPICRGLLRNPKEALACQHAFCGTCIDEWLVQSPSCPVCRKFLIPILLGRIHRIWKDKIEKIELKCPNHKRGCKVILHCNEIKEHCAECPYGTTKCPNSRCGKILLKSEVASHALICPCRSIYCPVCHTYITATVTRSHNCISTLWAEMHKELDKIRWEWVKVRKDFEVHYAKLEKMLKELKEEKKNRKPSRKTLIVVRDRDSSQSNEEQSHNCSTQGQADGTASVEHSEVQSIEQSQSQVARLALMPCAEDTASCNTANLQETIPCHRVNGLFIKWLTRRSDRERKVEGNTSGSSKHADVERSPSNSSFNVDLDRGLSNCSFNVELNRSLSNSSYSVDISLPPVNSSIQPQENQSTDIGGSSTQQQISAMPNQQVAPTEQESPAAEQGN